MLEPLRPVTDVFFPRERRPGECGPVDHPNIIIARLASLAAVQGVETARSDTACVEVPSIDQLERAYEHSSVAVRAQRHGPRHRVVADSLDSEPGPGIHRTDGDDLVIRRVLDRCG